MPILVKKLNNGWYELYDGYSRLINTKAEKVPCLILNSQRLDLVMIPKKRITTKRWRFNRKDKQ